MESNVAYGDDPERFATAMVPTSGEADRSFPALQADGQKFGEARAEIQRRFGRGTPIDYVVVAVESGRGEDVRQEIENKVLLRLNP